MKELPPPAPPLHRGRDERKKESRRNNATCPPPLHRGETDARKRYNVTMQRVLPLSKGELEGVQSKI